MIKDNKIKSDNESNDTMVTSVNNAKLYEKLKQNNKTNEAILAFLNNMVSNKGKNYRDITIGEWMKEWYDNYALNNTDKKYVKGKLSSNEYFVSSYRLKNIYNDTYFSNLKIDEVSSSDIYTFVSKLKSQKKILINENIKKSLRPTNTYLHYKSPSYDYKIISSHYENLKDIFPSIEFNKELYDKRMIEIKDHYTHTYENEAMSFKSKKNITDLLRMAFRCACKMELIKESPFENFKYDETKEIISKKRDALTFLERDIFLKVAESNKYFDCYLLMAYSGMRKGEALALCKKDIHINEGYIEINKQLQFTKETRYQNDNITSITKSMHSLRKVPIASSEVIEMFKRRMKDKNDDDFIFSGIDKYMWLSFNQIYKDVKRLYNICFFLTGNKKYINCHNHTLRHTFATLFLESYPNYLVQISAILGHSNTAFTAKQYVHLETEKIDISLLGERCK